MVYKLVSTVLRAFLKTSGSFLDNLIQSPAFSMTAIEVEMNSDVDTGVYGLRMLPILIILIYI